MNRRTYTCPFPACTHTYASKYNVRRHLKYAHPTYNQYECEQCGKTLCSKQNYRQHLHIHTGAKPFVCRVCGKCYRQGSQLSIHKRIHLLQPAPTVEISIPKVTSTQLTSMLQDAKNALPTDLHINVFYEAKDCILPNLYEKDIHAEHPVPLRRFAL